MESSIAVKAGSGRLLHKGLRVSSAIGVAILLLVAAGSVSSPAQSWVDRRPNILIIVTDDQRDGLAVMPATRRWFGRGGTTFNRAYATTPLCCPARASIMTGRYAHNHGVRGNADGDRLKHEINSAVLSTARRLHNCHLWEVPEQLRHLGAAASFRPLWHLLLHAQ